MDVVDEMNNTYAMSIKKGDHEYRIDQMSSGEREITNFLLGILSTDIRNGLVVVDEPELHLHPRWQSLLLEVLNEIEDLTKNQFIFTTHSPSFITRQSIKNVIRINKAGASTSETSQVDESNLSNDISDLVHIIHSSNNEKMFFADSVVLVEGPSDRVIFESLIEFYADQYETQEVIEVLKVDGKGNFAKYSNMLSNLNVDYTIVGDLDYITLIDNSEVDDLINSQTRKVKSSLTESEEERLTSFVDDKNNDDIYLLPNGELEDHLPYDDDKVENALDLTNPQNFGQWLSQSEEGTEILKEIAEEIVSQNTESEQL
jgi:putative ATP-dependent endonuclease of OLD family